MLHRAGDIIDGRYRVERVLGQGGMGGVYQATQIELDRTVALKEMIVSIPEPAVREAAVQQFRTEGGMLYTLQHPGLPRCYDFFEVGGNYYLAMDFIAGGTLDDYLQTHVVSEQQALQWTEELCAVMHYLHTHDPPIIFRDLKPSNIMLTPTGRIKLIDFGIAKVWDAQTAMNVTRTAIRGAGSPGFAAPEQYGGGTDERTDIYALGATIYSLLSRTMPPQSVEIASGKCELANLRELVPGISETTAHNIEWMMKLNLGERPQSIADIVKAFGWKLPSRTPSTRLPNWNGAPLTKLPARASVVSSETVVKPRLRSFPWRTVVLVVVALLIVALLAWKFVPRDRKPPALHPAEGVSTLAPSRPVKVAVRVSPPDSKLFVNELLQPLFGASPTVSLTPGTYTFAFEEPGYAESDQQVVVPGSGLSSPVEATLSPLPNTLHIETTPAGATIKIDADDLGKSPVDTHSLLPDKNYTMTVEAEGYAPVSTPVRIKAGEDKTISVRLTTSPPLVSTTTRLPSARPDR